MTWILTTIGAIIAGAVAKPVTVWFGKYTNSIRQDRALARLRGMYKRGDKVVALFMDSAAARLIMRIRSRDRAGYGIS